MDAEKSNKYLSLECQNDLIISACFEAIGQEVTFMIDETTDITKKEQVTVVIHTVGEDFEVDEDFIGFYTVSRNNACTLYSVVKDTLILPVRKL